MSERKRLLASCLVLGLIFVAQPAFADEEPPFPVGHSVSRFIQKISGVNALSAFVASKAATRALEKRLGGQVKAKIKSYSFTDLLAGKVKSLELTFRNARVRGIELGYLHVTAKNPLWFSYRKRKDEPTGVNTPVSLSLDGCVSQKDITAALKDPQVTSSLSTMKLDLPGLGNQQLEILEPDVKIENGKVKIRATVVTKGGKKETGVPVTVSAVPYLVEDGAKLNLKDMDIQSSEIENPAEFAQFVTELFNPLINFSRMDNGQRAFRLNDFKISGAKINFDGKLILAPRKTTSALAQKATITR
ncbi:MAG: hypothetical protein K2Y22_00295 [Candidatus Obscuribacterales bacterium]|nr:hypothetical protein [Candidatus Obscuribacterales bacterium]